MSLTGLTPEYRNWLRSSYLTNAANKLACAKSPYLLVPKSGTPSLTPFPCFSDEHIKNGGLHKSDARHLSDSPDIPGNPDIPETKAIED